MNIGTVKELAICSNIFSVICDLDGIGHTVETCQSDESHTHFDFLLSD